MNMSYHGGGHRRRQYRGEETTTCAEGSHLNSCTSSGGDDFDHRRESYETPEQKLRKSIINLGEVVRTSCRPMRKTLFKHYHYC